MKRRMTLGDFLVAYLHRIGVTQVFGIPGDLALKLFFALGKKHGLKIATFSHEPGVGFAADGYARATGKIGVVCVTYGAGGHNIVNPVAGSFSERVPLLIFSGGPGEEERKLGTLIHHQAREIESQHRIYEEVTCASRVLTDPRRAAADLHDVVRAVWAEQRPGYIEIHRDMVDREIEVPDEIIEWDGRLHFHDSDARKVEEAARETAAMFNAAAKPVVIAGIEIHRYKATHELVKLAEKMGAPVMTTVLGKGAFPMDHRAAHGRPRRADQSGADRRADGRGGLRAESRLPQDRHEFRQPAPAHYPGQDRMGGRPARRREVSHLHRRRRATISCARCCGRSCATIAKWCATPTICARHAPRRDVIEVSALLSTINDFLAAHRRYMVVAESGDMLFGGLDVRVPHEGTYLAQGFYASMGFAVPAAIGAQIGNGLRPLVLCGDGGFQMTGPEISHAPKFGANPIVMLINNGGWGIFRPIAERPRPARYSTVALCPAGRGLGRRRFRGEYGRGVAERP